MREVGIMSDGISITTNELRTEIVARLDRHYTARWERADEDAAKYVRGLVREYADEHCPNDEFVSAEVVGDDDTSLSYAADVRDWRQ